MLLLLSAALLLQAGAPSGAVSPDTGALARQRRDSIRTWRDSVSKARAARRRSEYASTLTPQVLRAAFADEATQRLYFRARAARLEQDSALLAYDATTYQRISAGLGFSRIGRDRLIFRHETAARVRWQRDRGAWVELKGARTVMPALEGFGEATKEVQEDLQDEASDDMAPIPYYPGREGMWIGGGMAKADVDEKEIIHPLAEGAERWYRFARGDSMTIRAGDRRFTLRELRVQAREPRWNLVVGSLWFDEGSGRLVRAVYRLAEPLDAFKVAEEVDGENPKDEIPVWVRPLVTPIVGSVDVVTVEYGLYEGRFWLPRVQRAEGKARVSFMRVPFSLEESYKYASVNGRLDSLPPLLGAAERQRMEDSAKVVTDSLGAVRKALRADSSAEGKRRLAEFDSARKVARAERRRQVCADGLETTQQTRWDDENPRPGDQLRVSVSVPCDRRKLATAPELPKSPYDPGDELFSSADMAALKEVALSLVTQPSFAPQKPTVYYGADLWRYNRVEGFAPAAEVRERFGAGYTGALQLRLGTADWQPNAELVLARQAGPRTVRFTGYRRLAVATDFGDPLAFGPSLAAALFGRDEGFYYRTAGAEVAALADGSPHLEMRAFVERHAGATKKTDLALPYLFGDGHFLANIPAERGSVLGLGLRVQGSHGLDPQGFRVLGDLRGEGGGGTWVYGRGLADVTLSQGFGRRTAAALTLSGGAAAGDVPVQRLFYLGGTQTVRGERPGAAVGNAFWMTRAEVGSGLVAVRPTVFVDMGWAGDRADWRHPGRPLTGAGIGASYLDGLVRTDLSRGIYPESRTRLDVYVEARF